MTDAVTTTEGRDPIALPFDETDMLARLRPWIECESPTYDPAAVSRMMDLAARDMKAMGWEVEVIPGSGGFGSSVRAKVPHPDHGKVPGIMVSGHMDTVHPVGTLQKNPWRVENGTAWGPGIQDMKGGNFVMVEAARLIAQAGWQTPLPITFLFTPDEEVGTPATRGLIEDEARKNAAVLLPEPALRNGDAVIGRFAIARFNLRTEGKPSHAGWLLKEGRSAIAEMARRILEIEAMTSDDCTFSVGVIHAGKWVNCVSSTCDAEVLSMAKTQADLDGGVAALKRLEGERNGVAFTVARGVTRPVWPLGQAGDQRLLAVAQGVAKRIGFQLGAQPSGGGSDGNFTGALGIPTLDSIGVRGEGLHTLGERIETASLVERGKLAAGLFMGIR
ncbi:M20/M25/M40 family metallo-hydrolase [Paracoccus sp. S-4012]|uniref:M20/M25/M40 family metallo-hydrolase n=1 Tax=Paracoccus sp. S-4012 TaxID=2665648 RepID=UPI0012B01AE4|nr:M20/M25/M40 family metallo-hydrolase [Paracoccus sp. S-4012]MRX50538.1 M20/M25/M40 family metallo-hydrolase [Paracoccus sp. S-4012]